VQQRVFPVVVFVTEILLLSHVRQEIQRRSSQPRLHRKWCERRHKQPSPFFDRSLLAHL
jgi:hypothetical protein